MFNKQDAHEASHIFFIITMQDGETFRVLNTPFADYKERERLRLSMQGYATIETERLYGENGMPNFASLVNETTAIPLRRGFGGTAWLNPALISSVKGEWLVYEGDSIPW